MAIELRCVCGRALRLRDELSGMSIRCPQCAAVIEVTDAVEVIESGASLAAAQAKPPPLPATDRAAAEQVEDEEFVEVVAVDTMLNEAKPVPNTDRSLTRTESETKVETEEAYVATPPLPVKRHPAPVPKQRRKKQSVYTEMYGDEPSEYGLYRDSRFLQNCVILGVIALLVVGLGVMIWAGAGLFFIVLMVVVIVGVAGLFFFIQDWWYW